MLMKSSLFLFKFTLMNFFSDSQMYNYIVTVQQNAILLWHTFEGELLWYIERLDPE